MKRNKWVALTCVLMATVTASSAALAYRGGHHHHHRHGGARIGLSIGVPLLGAPLGGYGYGYYAPSTTIVRVPAEPTVYVERGDGEVSGPASDGYWYYCRNPDGYYPSVRQCSGDWQRIPAQPSGR